MRLADIEAACVRANVPIGDVNWTYGVDGGRDTHLPATKKADVIMMGLNPGAGNGVAKGEMSKSERSWRTRCEKLTGRSGDQIVFAELIHESTLNERELSAKYGGDLRPVFTKAAEINLAVIAFHRPNIIYQMGINAPISDLYGLSPAGETVMRPLHPNEPLLRPFKMEDGAAWLSIRHLSAFGFSIKDRDEIRAYAARISGGGAA